MGREYPEHPMVGVAAIVIENGRVLLVKRDHDPDRGKWSVPGGLVEAGETLAAAVKRETREETGLIVEPGEMATLAEAITPDAEGRARFHYVLVDFFARPIGGRLQAGSDASDLRWATGQEAMELDLTAGVRAFLRELMARGRL
ncbi:MAG: NUDIX hydrolase [Bacillota bacterium]